MAIIPIVVTARSERDKSLMEKCEFRLISTKGVLCKCSSFSLLLFTFSYKLPITIECFSM